MPTPRGLMSKIRQAPQLLADSGPSMRQVAAALGVGKATFSEIARHARDAGVAWPLAGTLSDDELQARLYPPPRSRSSTRRAHDCATLHQELERQGLTLQLLWEQCRTHCGDGAGDAAYRYSAFCDGYRARVERQQRSMRPVHPGGERMFVDYAGHTVPVVGPPTSGGIRRRLARPDHRHAGVHRRRAPAAGTRPAPRADRQPRRPRVKLAESGRTHAFKSPPTGP